MLFVALLAIVLIAVTGSVVAPKLVPQPAPEKPAPIPVNTTFTSSVRAVDDAEQQAMIQTKTWRPECPLAIDQLRVVIVSYWGFDDKPHVGQIMVNKAVTTPVISVFHTLFDAKYPIHQMQLVQNFDGSDEKSMVADNTSSYNCRRSPLDGSWSRHAYGLAIDINPFENPEILNGTTVDPPSASRYADRTLTDKGVIQANDAVVKAFESIDWIWGGTWDVGWQDWQHFYTPLTPN